MLTTTTQENYLVEWTSHRLDWAHFLHRLLIWTAECLTHHRHDLRNCIHQTITTHVASTIRSSRESAPPWVEPFPQRFGLLGRLLHDHRQGTGRALILLETVRSLTLLGDLFFLSDVGVFCGRSSLNNSNPTKKNEKGSRNKYPTIRTMTRRLYHSRS